MNAAQLEKVHQHMSRAVDGSTGRTADDESNLRSVEACVSASTKFSFYIRRSVGGGVQDSRLDQCVRRSLCRKISRKGQQWDGRDSGSAE